MNKIKKLGKSLKNYLNKVFGESKKRIAILMTIFSIFLLLGINSYAHEGDGDILINAGGSTYTDSNGRFWSSDSFFNTGGSYTNSSPITQTTDDTIYQTERYDPAESPELQYEIPVANGDYEVRLHFAEIYYKNQGVGKRVFDVYLEGGLIYDNLDIYAEVGGYAPLIKTYQATVTDGALSISFGHVVQNPKVSGIEVHPIAPPPPPDPEPELFEARINAGGESYNDNLGKTWASDNSYNTGSAYVGTSQIAGTVDDAIYQSERWDAPTAPELTYAVAVPNGNYQITLHFAEIYSGTQGVGKRIFDVYIEGVLVEDNLDIYSLVGGYSALSKTYAVEVSDGAASITFGHVTENPKISGIEIVQIDNTAPHLAHAVPDQDRVVIDSDGNGFETVTLDGSFSHTHAFNEEVISWVWTENEQTISTDEIAQVNLSLGIHNITLSVEDSAGNTASDEVIIEVRVSTDAPGIIGYYYSFPSPLNSIPDTSGLKPDWGKIETNLNYQSTSGNFAGTDYADHFAANYIGLINIPHEGTYGFALESDDGSKLYIDNTLVVNNDGTHGMQKVSGNMTLTEGKHSFKIEFFENESGAGLKFYWTVPGNSEVIAPSSVLTHQYDSQLPVINKVTPSSGPLSGGNTVDIDGFGFVFDKASTQVKFGSTQVSQSDFEIIDDKTIQVTAPAMPQGSVEISVTTPNAESNGKTYIYSNSALPPIQFAQGTLLTGIDGPTSLAFGPDGKLYVGTQFGEVWKITFDANRNVTNTIVSNTIQTSEPDFRSILGIAFNPLDDPSNPKVYVSHSNLFHGQSNLANTYNGKVSILSGSNLNQKTDLITNLPVSDHDHGVNGIEFGINGEMFVQIGGNTNAGVPGSLSSTGLLDEAYFTAATIVAYVNDPDFNGDLVYDTNGIPLSTSSVDVYASGQRNPYDLLEHSNGKLYATDNGPNSGYGKRSTTCTTSGSDPHEIDELNLLVENGYYGHPNRLRGQTDSKQCVWRSINEASDANYTSPLTTFPASTNGLAEYWTNNFEGQMKGHVLASRWEGELYDLILSSSGNSVANKKILTTNGGLDVAVSPDGTIYLAQNSSDKIIYHTPDEPVPSGLHINSVFPYKGPATGGRDVTILGSGFGNTEDTAVTIGGNICNLISVSSTKIICTTPVSSASGANAVVVNVSGQSKTLEKGYVYVAANSAPDPDPEPEPDGTWSALSNLPVSLGEISAAVVNNEVYIFHGEDGNHTPNNKLYKYNSANNTWAEASSQNAVPATDHAAAGVINGKIYVFGGFGSSGESNSLAMYDPATNTWTSKASLTKSGSDYGVGSPASGVINGKLYISGGIHANTTISNTFVYDPATDSWSELASMPAGRNHAVGIGYNGKLYVFGGRCCGGNTTGLGNNNTYIYDPTSNSWSTGANLPTARGGMGSAVELNGELLVIGGEGSGPSNGTFPNVEAYNPATNTWRGLPDLPTPRHGIFPINANGKIHVVAGGTAEGFSVSNIHEVYTPENGGGTPTPTPTPSLIPTPTPSLTGTPTPTPNPSVTPVPSPTPTPGGSNTLRINTGGSGFTDTDGNIWSGDLGFNTGNSYITSTNIIGTSNQNLYKSERWDAPDSPELSYSFSLANGNYSVILHFADIYSGTQGVGKRVFDVGIEGNTVLDNYDIFAEVGGFAASRKEFNISLTDGSLNIDFAHVMQNPKISGIEILRQ